MKTLQFFYKLRNIFNCVLPHWRHLIAGLLYNDFGSDGAHTVDKFLGQIYIPHCLCGHTRQYTYIHRTYKLLGKLS